MKCVELYQQYYHKDPEAIAKDCAEELRDAM